MLELHFSYKSHLKIMWYSDLQTVNQIAEFYIIGTLIFILLFGLICSSYLNDLLCKIIFEILECVYGDTFSSYIALWHLLPYVLAFTFLWYYHTHKWEVKGYGKKLMLVFVTVVLVSHVYGVLFCVCIYMDIGYSYDIVI